MAKSAQRRSAVGVQTDFFLQLLLPSLGVPLNPGSRGCKDGDGPGWSGPGQGTWLQQVSTEDLLQPHRPQDTIEVPCLKDPKGAFSAQGGGM
jgi:hypothetical protein